MCSLFLVPRRDRSDGGAPAVPWWQVAGKTCIGAWQAKGAASLADSYINLANPGTYDLTASNAPTWDVSTGWTFNGTTQFLITGMTGTNESYSLFVRYSNASGTTQAYLVAAYDVTTNFGIQYTNGFGSRQYWNAGGRSVAGLVAAAVRGFAAKDTYYDGASDGTIGAGTGTNGRGLYIGARNSNGVADQKYTGDIQAVVVYSDTLTAGEVSTLTTTINAL